MIGSLFFPWQANPRCAILSSSEFDAGYRKLSGDKGDLTFEGYEVYTAGTELLGVRLLSNLDLTYKEAEEIAIKIVESAYTSVGAKCVEHSLTPALDR